MITEKIAIIIGAGPAGLTAAYELLQHTDIKPVIFETSSDFGGISKTVNYKGNFIDIGGHRFFSKSERVMDWWKNILPIERIKSNENQKEAYTDGPDPEKANRVMLVRTRLSKIYFLRKFFSYPVSLNFKTIKNLGFYRLIRIGFSYIFIKLFPVKDEISLEDFFINRFGEELYKIFFKDYTEKVWGVPCSNIKAEWGSQRIKGLSVTKALRHAVRTIFIKDKNIAQKKIETSLIDRFFYPKYGPGQMWKEVARQILEKGGEIYMQHEVVGLSLKSKTVEKVKVLNIITGKEISFEPDYVFSSMPVKDLINSMGENVPENVRSTANGLIYRDFITIGLLLDKLLIRNINQRQTKNDLVPYNWIYIQEPDVKVGRIQIFNNWSPYMLKDPEKVWIGLEYFCDEGDLLWSKSDKEIIELAINEIESIDIIDKKDVLDNVLIRMIKTYPAYFGTYDNFYQIREFTDKIKNLFLVGRNGMHRYNNQDHSMLTSMTAVENIINGIDSKDNIWTVNTEEEYHEE